MTSTLRLQAENLGKRFGRRLLFRRLELTLNGGESLAVTGANGAGKSTLLQILARLLSPTTGDVRLYENERPVIPEQHPLRVGLVAPYLNVYDGFTPRENLMFIGRARSLSDISARIEGVLETVGLSDRMDDHVSTFSSGMKQRVKFAAALLAKPSLLLLDEPRVNLDADGLAMVARLVRSHQENGGIVVVATNDSHEAERHSAIIRIENFR